MQRLGFIGASYDDGWFLRRLDDETVYGALVIDDKEREVSRVFRFDGDEELDLIFRTLKLAQEINARVEARGRESQLEPLEATG